MKVLINGSEIKVLDNCSNKPSDVPMMIFAVDMANPDSEDYSCINYYCSCCKNIVSTIHFKNGIDNNEPILPANCPSCGVRFKGWIHSN